MSRPATNLATIHSLDEIPDFETEAEEREYWDTHQFSEELFEKQRTGRPGWLPPPRPRSSPVSIRFDADTVKRLKSLARKKGKGYQTLLKEFVSERLAEEEKREAISDARQ